MAIARYTNAAHLHGAAMSLIELLAELKEMQSEHLQISPPQHLASPRIDQHLVQTQCVSCDVEKRVSALSSELQACETSANRFIGPAFPPQVPVESKRAGWSSRITRPIHRGLESLQKVLAKAANIFFKLFGNRKKANGQCTCPEAHSGIRPSAAMLDVNKSTLQEELRRIEETLEYTCGAVNYFHRDLHASNAQSTRKLTDTLHSLKRELQRLSKLLHATEEFPFADTRDNRKCAERMPSAPNRIANMIATLSDLVAKVHCDWEILRKRKGNYDSQMNNFRPLETLDVFQQIELKRLHQYLVDQDLEKFRSKSLPVFDDIECIRYLANCEQHRGIFREFTCLFRQNKPVSMILLANRAVPFSHFDAKFRGDRDVMCILAQQDGWVLQLAQMKVRADREVVLAAVHQNGRALQFASAELRDDREVVLAAVRQNGLALEFASKELRADQEVILAAIVQNGDALKFANELKRTDKELIAIAKKQLATAKPNQFDKTTLSSS